MIERIRNIISAKQMSSSGFADAIGVPRSTISHILSGRNNPSLELVQKILDAFPDIRTQWLVRGDGDMSDRMQDLFSQQEGVDDVNERKGQTDIKSAGSDPDRMAIKSFGNEESERKATANKIVFGGTGKRPVKVLILHEDGTFAAYLPDETP